MAGAAARTRDPSAGAEPDAPPPAPSQAPAPPRLLVLACGALASEILYSIRINRWRHMTLDCLPARLHNTPELIAPELEKRLRTLAGRYDRVLVGYADCGTGGRLDALIERWDNVERIPAPTAMSSTPPPPCSPSSTKQNTGRST